MPNLANNTFLKKFPLNQSKPKQIVKQKSNQFSYCSDDNKAVSPPSQPIYYGLNTPNTYGSNYYNPLQDCSRFSTNSYSPELRGVELNSSLKFYGKQHSLQDKLDNDFGSMRVSPPHSEQPSYNISVKSVKEFSQMDMDKVQPQLPKTTKNMPTGLLNLPSLKISMQITDDLLTSDVVD